MTRQIYLDYMATTPVDSRVVSVMRKYLDIEGEFGNPASNTHHFGLNARKAIDVARDQVAALINALPEEIVWTSGSTEANNLALLGAMRFYQRRGKHLLTMATEHKSVLDTCHYLERNGYVCTYLNPDGNGCLNLQELEDNIRPDTVLVSVMHVNNETGVVQDLARIADIVKARGALFHTDAAQSNGKLSIDVKKLPVDLLSLSSHKIYGPKGVGALYVRSKPQIRLEALIHGGGHERGMRSGTLATHQIAGMGQAFDIAISEMKEDQWHAQRLTERLWTLLQETDVIWNGFGAARVPNCMNLCFPEMRGESLILSAPSLAFSVGSACNSATPKPSHVLTAMGISNRLADCSVRLSVGRFTTLNDVELAGSVLLNAYKKLKQLL